MSYSSETIKAILAEIHIKEIIAGIKEEGNKGIIKPSILQSYE